MRVLFLPLLLLLIMVQSTVAAEKALPSSIGRDNQPIQISSERLEADDIARQVKFIGKVVVRRGDLSLYADDVLVMYLQGKGDIEQIVATGGVRIIQGDRIATADRATLFQKEGKIVLNGSARLLQGQDSVQGEEVTVFINEEKSIIKGQEGGRVNAIFHPSETGGER